MHKKKISVIVGLVFLLLILVVVVFSRFFSLFGIFFDKEIELKKVDDNINILLLGIAGGTHGGPNLTDTIIFVSLNSREDKVVLVSIPRDLWITELKGRINIAYAKGGISMAKSFVSKIVGQPIDYILLIDFYGFEKAINLLGGIDVNTSSALDDYEYPIFGKEDDPCGHSNEELKALATASSQLAAFPCRYSHLHFDKGLQHMDGNRALEFIRSRHAEGEEGTDFARNKRQGEVIKAIKDKVISLQTLLNPGKVIGLYSLIKGSIDTNIKEDEIDDFIKLANKMKSASLQNVVLDYGDQEKNQPGLLMHPDATEDYDKEWVLIPRTGNNNFSEIQKYVECEIKSSMDRCPEP